MAARDKNQSGANRLPDRDELLAYIRDNDGDSVRRDIARAFGVRGAKRAELRAMLRELEDAGLIERGDGRKWRPSDRLPPVAVLEVYDLDDDGEPLLRPVSWDADQPPPGSRARSSMRWSHVCNTHTPRSRCRPVFRRRPLRAPRTRPRCCSSMPCSVEWAST